MRNTLTSVASEGRSQIFRMQRSTWTKRCQDLR